MTLGSGWTPILTTAVASALLLGVVAGLTFYLFRDSGHGRAVGVDVGSGATSLDLSTMVDSVKREAGRADSSKRVLVSGEERGGLSFRLVSALTGLSVAERSIDLIDSTSGAVTRTVMTGKDGRFRLALDEDSKSVRLVVALGDRWAQHFDLFTKRRGSFNAGERSLLLHDLCEVQVVVPGLGRTEFEMGIVQLAVTETVLPETVVAQLGVGGRKRTQERTLSRRLKSRQMSLRVPHGTRLTVSLKSVNEVITSSSQKAVAPCRLSFALTRKPVMLVRFLPMPNDVRTCAVLFGHFRGGVFEQKSFLGDRFPVLNQMSLIPIDDLRRHRKDGKMAFRIIGLGDTWFGQSEIIEAPHSDEGLRSELIVAVSKRAGIRVRVVRDAASRLYLEPYILNAVGSLTSYPTADSGDGYGMIQEAKDGFLLRNLGRTVPLVIADIENSVFLPARVAPWDKEVVVRAKKQEDRILERGRTFAIRETKPMILKDGAFHVLIDRRLRMFGREVWATCRRYRVALPSQRKGPFTDSFWNISTGHDYRVRILVKGNSYSLSPVFTH